MFKRNDGYALSYVLVVLMVLAIISTAVMAPPLRNLQMQQASIERMKDKYIAQGMVEQVVAQLDGVTTPPNIADISHSQGVSVTVDSATNTYTIKATTSSGKTTITAEVKLSKPDDTAKYSISYLSYNTEVGS